MLIWSCGNESFGGSVIYEMSQVFRQRDRNRLVHYEGIVLDRSYPDTSDLESQMYTPAAKVEQFLKEHPEKPMILCEYSHAMGNSCGGLHKYTDLSRREPRYQGGFIWDFADQALWKQNVYGDRYLGYGGDFGDRPHDGSFSGDGLVSGDRIPSPKLQEVKFLYQTLDLLVSPDRVNIVNRNLFVSSARYLCRVKVERDGVTVEEQVLPTDVPPLSEKTYPLALRPQSRPGQYTVTASFHLREPEIWAEAGHEVAFGQYGYEIADNAEPETAPLEIIHSGHCTGFRGENFEAIFNGNGPVSYRWGGQELLDKIPKPNFWRAPTDNDKGNRMAARYGQWKLASLYADRVRITEDESQYYPHTMEEGAEEAVLTYRYWLPTSPEAFCDLVYRVSGTGKITVTLHYDPVPGLSPMPEFGMLLTLPPELDRVKWYGLGPADTYCDRKMGGRLGLYEAGVQECLAPYLVPQECGNHEEVRYAEVTDGKGAGLRFETETPCCFSALPYTPHQLEEADHAWELPKPAHTVVRMALAQMGVAGDDTWGARTHPEYLLPNDKPLTFTFSFTGI